MTIEDLKALQDQFIEWAKFRINKDQNIQAISFVLMRAASLDKMKELGGTVDLITPKDAGWFKGMKEHDIVAVAREWSLSWKEKYGVLYRAIPEEKREIVATLLEMGKQLDIDDEYMRVGRALMKVMECQEKDVVSLALRQMCEVCDAIAIINISECWAATGDHAKRHHEAGAGRSLEDDAESIEVLMVSLEALAIERTVMIPIQRRPGKKRGTGKVTGWGKRDEMSTETHPNLVGAGRFYQLLKPLEHTVKA